MAEFKIPELGEGIEAGVVVSVLVTAGDEVVKDQPLLELETDKAVVEVPSSMIGTVKQILIKPGDKARVGQAVIVFEAADESVAAAPDLPPAPSSVEGPSPPHPLAPSPDLPPLAPSPPRPLTPSPPHPLAQKINRWRQSRAVGAQTCA